jgi:hypothetical protein
MPGYGEQAGDGVFVRSRELFESLIAELAGGEMTGCTHAELEERLTDRGRELLRSLMQDHLSLRTVREERADRVTGSDHIERTRVERGHRRGLATVFGPVTVTRMAYRAPGARNLYLADAALNLPEGRHSDGLAKMAVIESVRGSFDDAAEAIGRASGVAVGKPQLLAMVRGAAADIEAFYAQRLPGPAPGALLVQTYDGKGIVMRPEALRAGTVKAAAKASQKLSTRLSPGEKNGRKRMAELGCVYDAEPVPRTPGDVLARSAKPGQDATRRRGPVATGKWLTGSVTDDIAAVIAAGFDEATRRDPGHERTWVALVDGNNTQIQAIKAEATRREAEVRIVVDFIHVAEYVWGAAWSFFDKGDADAETWVAGQLTKILHGKAGDVAAGIRRRATRFGYTSDERKGADEAANYLTSKKPYLDYATALAAGWPIATGVIEGACRHLVKDRMDITGARWGLEGAEAILRLRALNTSGDLDDYWQFHLLKQHQRRHETRYARHQNTHTLAA